MNAEAGFVQGVPQQAIQQVQAQPELPFSPPEAVQQWLRQEDWEVLSKAWADVESKAIEWADSDEWDDGGLWEETPSSYESSTSTKRNRRKPAWNQDFNLLGSDSRRPAPLRRYFDPTCKELSSKVMDHSGSEGSLLQGTRRPRKQEDSLSGGGSVQSSNASRKVPQKEWVDTWWQTVTGDNDNLHPHLRHYFDRRGLEASYRTRPEVDKVTPAMQPRTPGRPPTRERILKYSASEPSLMEDSQPEEEEEVGTEGRYKGNISWGARCLKYGQQRRVRPKAGERRVPWVQDHHVSVTSDNSQVNPMVRHYFDKTGLESSYRNRGHHYGREPMQIKAFGRDKPNPLANVGTSSIQ